MVDMIVRQGKKYQRVLDIGTGSGVILLSLLKAGVAAKGTGADISREALEVARINLRRLRLEGRTELIHSDRFTQVKDNFDLIVSNPPYIKATAHRSLVQDSVDRHEPHIALYLDDANFEAWFHEFFAGVLRHLSPGGEFWMEGHEKELQIQAVAMERLGFTNVRVLKDYAGLDRFLHAYGAV